MKRYLMLFFIFGAVFAFASTTGGGLPWEGPLQTVKASITGPVAFIISLLAIVAAGVGLVFGGEFSGFIKTLLYIVLVVALIVGAVNFMSIFGISGGLI
ncbi:TrbC/VirB2 family protein (plasmid) [Campylobacter fetus]|uniref:TrbC/VirB2 family protein n=1 Tax=Campylobacter fetus TaxID=196 RepID=UPI00080BDAA9|nr:TrbC/VirB2 family protein [Campylobacter fetus]KAA3682677.1 conjugal transfer protein TrbC [Campylobacter fetus subsp. venerealis]OCS23458.1 conjugal transfer protein TrbC [Campylobacter fetus subsp. venerealis cfvi9825]